jgi:hypothetical protein
MSDQTKSTKEITQSEKSLEFFKLFIAVRKEMSSKSDDGTYFLADVIRETFDRWDKPAEPQNIIEVYSQNNCPFKYCDAPELCKKENACRYDVQ